MRDSCYSDAHGTPIGRQEKEARDRVHQEKLQRHTYPNASNDSGLHEISLMFLVQPLTLVHSQSYCYVYIWMQQTPNLMFHQVAVRHSCVLNAGFCIKHLDAGAHTTIYVQYPPNRKKRDGSHHTRQNGIHVWTTGVEHLSIINPYEWEALVRH